MPRRIGVREVARCLPPGGRVFVQAGASQPTPLLEAIAHSEGVDQSFVTAAFPGVNEFDLPSLGTDSTATVFYPTRRLATGLAGGRIACVPLHQSGIGPYLAGTARPDALLVQVTPPDGQGRCSLGIGADFVPLLDDPAITIVAEVNTRMPRVPDAPWLDWSRLSYVLETDRPLPMHPEPDADEGTLAVARVAAGLIDDGACLQAGIGGLPAALVRLLTDRRDLSIHSGIVGDGLARLIGCGAVTGRYKPATHPAAVTAYVAGTGPTYALAAAGRIAVRPPGFTHDIGVIGGIDRFVSINAALEIDLFGQVNAESIDGRVVSGAGGFVDFVRGARRSRGGMSIVLLASTGQGGARSRIVAALPPGTPVTCSRADVDIVVTEHGVARLRHLDIDARALRLIELAAPQCREALGQAWTLMRRRLYG
jgi:4-hydroxybutyrate CoA-transferase